MVWRANQFRNVIYSHKLCGVHVTYPQTGHDGSPTLVIPWSGENLTFVDEVRPGETCRPRRDKVLACAKREGLSRVEVFSTRVTNHEVRTQASLCTWPFDGSSHLSLCNN